MSKFLMHFQNKRTAYIAIAFAVVGIVLDQATKMWAVASLSLYTPWKILPFFSLQLAYNPGASFGILADTSFGNALFFIVAIIFSAASIRFILKTNQISLELLAWTLLLSGALGNAIDRVLHGQVVDFLSVHLVEPTRYYFPTFNVADALITMGAIALIALIVKDTIVGHKKTAKNKKHGSS